MKKVIGIIIIVLVLSAMVGSVFIVAGWVNGLIIWGLVIFITALLILATNLIGS